MVGRLLSNLLGFVVNVVLTRTFGPALYGLYAFGNVVVGMALLVTSLGADKSLLRYLPALEDDHETRDEVFGLAAATGLVGSVVVAVPLFVFAPEVTRLTLDDPQFTPIVRLFTVIIVVKSVTKILTNAFRGLELMRFRVVVSDVVRPVARLAGVGVAVAAGFSIAGTVGAIGVGMVVTLVVAAALLVRRTDLRPRVTSSKELTREFYNYSLPLSLKDAGTFLYRRVDILMVGFFLTSSAVGVYNVAAMLAMFLALPLSAVGQLFPPVASRLHTQGDHAELDDVYGTVTRWAFTMSLVMAIGAVVYRTELLSVFGSGFTRGETVLALFVAAQLVNNAVGPSGYVLMMTDHQYLNLANQWTLGVLNVGLNYLFIEEFGLVGAALATSIVLVLLNVVRLSEVWYFERLFPYSLAFVKPVTAGAVAAVVMLAARPFLDGLVLLFAGGALGVAAYAGALVLLGIEDDDVELFEETVGQMAG